MLLIPKIDLKYVKYNFISNLLLWGERKNSGKLVGKIKRLHTHQSFNYVCKKKSIVFRSKKLYVLRIRYRHHLQWNQNHYEVAFWFTAHLFLLCKVETILKGSLDLIPSPSPSVKIQIMGGKVCLRCKGKTLLGVANKLLKTKGLLT